MRRDSEAGTATGSISGLLRSRRLAVPAGWRRPARQASPSRPSRWPSPGPIACANIISLAASAPCWLLVYCLAHLALPALTKSLPASAIHRAVPLGSSLRALRWALLGPYLGRVPRADASLCRLCPTPFPHPAPLWLAGHVLAETACRRRAELNRVRSGCRWAALGAAGPGRRRGHQSVSTDGQGLVRLSCWLPSSWLLLPREPTAGVR